MEEKSQISQQNEKQIQNNEQKQQQNEILSQTDINNMFNANQINNIYNWIKAIAIVTFDIDEGQVIEKMYPENKQFTDEEQKQLSMMSFPDSSSMQTTQMTIQYIFRLKRNHKDSQKKFSFAFTFFLQKRDPNLQRGYLQKSLVIVTDHPFIKFYNQLVQNIGIRYFFEQDLDENKFLQNVCEQISNWPAPNHVKFDLNMNDEKIFQEEEKQSDDSLQKIESIQNKTQSDHTSSNGNLSAILSNQDNLSKGNFQDVNILNFLEGHKVNLLWQIWQIIITNQPTMVVCDNPSICSEGILAMISLISPLEYIGDFRPYFTIYDPDYKSIQDEIDRKMYRNVLLGVTNQFFLKTFKEFPYTIRFDNLHVQDMKKKYKSEFPQKYNKYIKTNKQFQDHLIEMIPDETLLKRLLQNNSPEVQAINNTQIRQYFRILTKQFMQVFDHYFITQRNEIKIFEEKEFILYLKTYKFPFSHLFDNKRLKIITLYERFIRSANFTNYVQSQNNVYFSKGKKI